MPKFFIDQNIPGGLAKPLSAAFPESQFKAAFNEGLHQIDDVDLFPTLHSQAYDAIITADKAQLDVVEEREGLRDSSLHFIGLRIPPRTGREQFVILASTLIIGLHHVLADWRNSPSAYLLDHQPLLRPILHEPESL